MPTDKEHALIAIGASLAAGCQPCTAHHIKAARAAGACNRSVTLAVETGLAMRDSATRFMTDWAAECQGPRSEIDAEFRTQKQRIADLTAVAAALALNSAADLEKSLAAARSRGASSDEIEAALAIARTIRQTAQEKVEAVQVPAASPCCAPASACGCK
jgi:AhpD family alkylhydroperoxidase